MNGGFSPAWMPQQFRQVAAAAGIAVIALLLAGPGASSAAAKKRKSPLPSKVLGFTPNTAVTHQDLRRMDRIGASTIRYNLAWSVLQRRRHNPIDWDKPDRFIKRASRAGLDLDLLLGTTPDWARSSPDTDRWTPPLSSNFAREKWKVFVGAAARRYGHGGSFWEDHPDLNHRPVAWTIWNEPNLPRYWGGPPTPGVFANLVELTGGVLRRVDPKGTIVAGGIFCQGPWKSYLSLFYNAVDQSSFDALAFHPYHERPYGVNRITLGGRRIMDKAGDTEGALWIDEISWGTDVSMHRFTYRPKKQAKNMRILFQVFQDERDQLNLGKVLWYGIRDDPESNICRFCATSGLWFEGGERPKPAWFVFKGFASEPSAAIRGRVLRRKHRPVRGQTVFLDLNNDGFHQIGEPEVTTGKKGAYSFHRLFPTKYVVRLEPSDNKACKRPRDCARVAEVASGKAKRKQKFSVKPAPRTTITAANVAGRKATFKFHARRAHPPYRFRCKLDHRGYRKCSSPKAYRSLKPGEHTVKVRATDARGTVDRTPAKKSFEIRR